MSLLSSEEAEQQEVRRFTFPSDPANNIFKDRDPHYGRVVQEIWGAYFGRNSQNTSSQVIFTRRTNARGRMPSLE